MNGIILERTFLMAVTFSASFSTSLSFSCSRSRSVGSSCAGGVTLCGQLLSECKICNNVVEYDGDEPYADGVKRLAIEAMLLIEKGKKLFEANFFKKNLKIFIFIAIFNLFFFLQGTLTPRHPHTHSSLLI